MVKSREGEVLADLVRHGDRYVAALGGRGGRGNSRFLSNARRAPSFAEQGEYGEELVVPLRGQAGHATCVRQEPAAFQAAAATKAATYRSAHAGRGRRLTSPSRDFTHRALRHLPPRGRGLRRHASGAHRRACPRPGAPPVAGVLPEAPESEDARHCDPLQDHVRRRSRRPAVRPVLGDVAPTAERHPPGIRRHQPGRTWVFVDEGTETSTYAPQRARCAFADLLGRAGSGLATSSSPRPRAAPDSTCRSAVANTCSSAPLPTFSPG